jgi:hypothetical protein
MLSLVVGGCTVNQKDLGGEKEMLESRVIEDHTDPRTIDDRFAEVARINPAFGGMFFNRDDNEILYVYLSDNSSEDAVDRGRKPIMDVEAAIASVLGNDLPPVREIRTLKGRYNFLQLKQWHDSLGALFALPEVLTTDIDDANNVPLVLMPPPWCQRLCNRLPLYKPTRDSRRVRQYSFFATDDIKSLST